MSGSAVMSLVAAAVIIPPWRRGTPETSVMGCGQGCGGESLQ
jgi:hypothetical protein